MTTKVLVDTDLGSDIDDAVALAYLLAQPECELLGITTVSGQARERAMLVSALCRWAGQDIPIAPGAEHPLLVPQVQPDALQASALRSLPHDTVFPAGPAVELLRTVIHRHPGEIVLLTIGPLTNVALLFAVDPEVPGLLKGLVSMAGSFWSGINDGYEWNIGLDPHAAAMVYRTPVPSHRSVGLDVTSQVKMSADEVRERFQSGPLRPVLEFAEVWFGGGARHVVTFHDPLAAAAIFDDGVCRFDAGMVTVENIDPAGSRPLGATRWSAGTPGAPHEVATSVDPARFFAHYFDILS